MERPVSVLLFAVLLAAGCAGSSPKKPAAATRLKAMLTLHVRVTESGVYLSGTTNLPPGTKLILEVESEVSANGGSGLGDGNYIAEAKESVVAGSFSPVKFDYRGRRFPVGRYVASATMPIAEVQPAHVRAVIGQHGENLSGALVQRSGVGTTVETRQWFRVARR